MLVSAIAASCPEQPHSARQGMPTARTQECLKTHIEEAKPGGGTTGRDRRYLLQCTGTHTGSDLVLGIRAVEAGCYLKHARITGHRREQMASPYRYRTAPPYE